MRESLLVDGNIPIGKECPFRKQCTVVATCKHLGKFHKVEFSCATARAYDMFTELKEESNESR